MGLFHCCQHSVDTATQVKITVPAPPGPKHNDVVTAEVDNYEQFVVFISPALTL